MKTIHCQLRTRRALALLSLLALLIPASSAFAESAAPGSARPGWYLGIGSGGARLDLDDAVEARFSALDVDLSETGQGGSIFVGYSFGRRFDLELNLNAQELSTGRQDIDAAAFGFEIVAVAPLMPEARVSPYLLGTVGGGGLAFTGGAIEDKSLVAAQTGVGAGVEVHLSRRFSLDFDYRVAVQHYQEEVLDVRGQGDQTLDIEGSGTVQRWGMRVVFSF